MGDVAIVVHGGAGRMPSDPDRLERMKQGAAVAVEAGHAVLSAGGSALDAVEAAIVVLEDDPEFNAGRGAALTEDGSVELDASIMEGTGHRSGAVAGVAGVRNPIRAARAVLDKSEHVLFVGEGARRFADEHGIELCHDAWHATDRQREVLAAGGEVWAEGTVGAVARDAEGRLAAATSTGGMMGQVRGRVGDSPLIENLEGA